MDDYISGVKDGEDKYFCGCCLRLYRIKSSLTPIYSNIIICISCGKLFFACKNDIDMFVSCIFIII